MEVLKIIGLIACLIIVTVAYACCMVASTSDEQAERMFRDYMKWKEKHETDKRRRAGMEPDGADQQLEDKCSAGGPADGRDHACKD